MTKEQLATRVAELLDDVNADRGVLSDFLQKMISEYKPDQYVGIAEYVSKVADALTRQNQVRAGALKTLDKAQQAAGDDDDDLSDIHKQVGLPFEDDLDPTPNSN